MAEEDRVDWMTSSAQRVPVRRVDGPPPYVPAQHVPPPPAQPHTTIIYAQSPAGGRQPAPGNAFVSGMFGTFGVIVALLIVAVGLAIWHGASQPTLPEPRPTRGSPQVWVEHVGATLADAQRIRVTGVSATDGTRTVKVYASGHLGPLTTLEVRGVTAGQRFEYLIDFPAGAPRGTLTAKFSD